jgi:parallel beta-helix repeat protein
VRKIMSVGVILGEKKRFFHWGLVFTSVFAAVLFVILSSSIAQAVTTVPTKMNFQGRLANSAGNILADGTYNMKFRIYNASSGGTLQWSEDRLVSATQGVTVTNGQFSVQLGSVTSLPASIFTSNSLYFEVELPTPATATSSSPSWTEGPMTPRNQLATSAYAYNAETLDGLDSADFAAASGSTNYIQNTTTPQTANLTVQGASNSSAIVSITQGSSTGNLLVVGNGSTTGLTINSSGNTSVHGDLAVKNVTLAVGKTLTMAGDTTANRPGSPTEGMIFYDTTTKKLEVYSNGKWQADRTDAVIVAASDSSQTDKDAADYVADGNTGAAADGDQVQINSALTAGSGKKVVLLAGTYVADATIAIPNNTTLTGVGRGTLIELADIDATDNLIENSDMTTGSGVVVQNLRLNGRKDLNTAGTQHAVYLDDMGTVSTNLPGATVKNITVQNFRNSGVYLNSSESTTVTGNTSLDNDEDGIGLVNSPSNIVTSNIVEGTGQDGINLFSSPSSSVTNNIIQGSGEDGIVVNASALVTVTGNTTQGNADSGIKLNTGANGTVSANIVSGNALRGIYVWINSNNNNVSGNSIYDNGGTTDNNGIHVVNSDSNTITGNTITDSSATTTNYAINIGTSTADTNYLANNSLGTGSINDVGTGTIYANQLNSSGQLINRSSGGFAIQGAGGTNLFSAAGTASITIGSSDTTGTVLVLDTKTDAGDPTGTAGGMYYNSSTGKFRCYQAGAWKNCDDGGNATTLDGIDSTGFAQLGINNTFTGANTINVANAAAFDVQNGSAASVFRVDTANTMVRIGSTIADSTGVVLVLDTKNTSGDPTGVDGAMYYNSSLKAFRCYQAGEWRSCIGGLAASSTSAQTISGTTATDFTKNYTIPADACVPGRVYRITARGVYTTGLTAGTITISVIAGSTTLLSSSVAPGGSATNRQWVLNADVICQTAGATGTVEAAGTFMRFTGAAASTNTEMLNTAPITLDTTAAQILKVRSQATQAATSLTVRQVIFEALGP